MEINFKPEDIENYVKDALIKSSIGKAIDKAVADCLSKNYDNPIEQEIKKVVSCIAIELIRDKYAAQVKALVQEKIEQSVTNEMLEKVTSTAIEKLQKSLNDRY